MGEEVPKVALDIAMTEMREMNVSRGLGGDEGLHGSGMGEGQKRSMLELFIMDEDMAERGAWQCMIWVVYDMGSI